MAVRLFTSPTKSQLIRNPAETIKTYIFINVELSNMNTGWPCEICAIAIHINELKRAVCGSSSSGNTFLPRIQDKLTLCLDPSSSFNEHISTLSKLNNNILEEANKCQFDDNAVGLLYQFLLRQEVPICLLSHNGFRVDFAVLRLELQKLGRSLDSIKNEDLLCADSLWTFKEIDNKLNNVESVKDNGVSILDMVYYTQGSLFYRYVGKTMPFCHTSEEKNIRLMELVCCQLEPFLENLCCKKFSLVNTLSRPEKPVSVIHNVSYLSNSSICQPSCQTYVFLDIETTGLKDPRITEICLMAIHKSSLERTEIGAIPRVCDKLLLVLNPQSTIHEVASQLSDLNNPLINKSNKPMFDIHTMLTLAYFLQRQSQPVCLLAHNGKNFDFRILRSHLESIPNISLDTSIFSKVFCSDTLTAIRSLWQNQTKTLCNDASFKQRPSFALKEVYRRCFSTSPEISHYAEADVATLIKLCNFIPNLLSTLEIQMTKFM